MTTDEKFDQIQKQLTQQQDFVKAVLDEFQSVKKEMRTGFAKTDAKIDALDFKIDSLDSNLTKRLDKLGSQLAYVEDDTPTRKEFDNLQVRVHKLEQLNVTQIS